MFHSCRVEIYLERCHLPYFLFETEFLWYIRKFLGFFVSQFTSSSYRQPSTEIILFNKLCIRCPYQYCYSVHVPKQILWKNNTCAFFGMNDDNKKYQNIWIFAEITQNFIPNKGSMTNIKLLHSHEKEQKKEISRWKIRFQNNQMNSELTLLFWWLSVCTFFAKDIHSRWKWGNNYSDSL